MYHCSEQRKKLYIFYRKKIPRGISWKRKEGNPINTFTYDLTWEELQSEIADT